MKEAFNHNEREDCHEGSENGAGYAKSGTGQ